MNEASPGILILGGGVAGMSAALALSRHDLEVHLVEKKDRLGGNTADWACMATGICQNCGACLSLEMADQVHRTDHISIHLNTELTTLDRTGPDLEATLSSGEHLTAAKAVMATGFTPFDPATIPSYHTQTLEKVITTARLNTLLREDRLAEVTGSAPKIAFLQCIGSRNREQNRDYCSQVCCKISMRHAQKIHHLMPDADISLFYMDLQIIGKEIRTMADQLSQKISFIQGVPAEILENSDTGKLTMITEDPATLSRKSRPFDLVILSVGMTPNQEISDLSKILEASPNSWGFFNTPDGNPGKDVQVAGCAQGPKDILSAIQDGQIAATNIIQELGLSTLSPKGIAVLGSGPQASVIARKFAEKKDAPKITQLKTASILSVDGTMDNFSIRYHNLGKKQTLNCAAIIAAPQPNYQSNQDFPTAVSLAQFSGMPPQKRPVTSLILLDYFGPESKSSSRQALLTAMETQGRDSQVTVLMNKMLVHGSEGQQLYDRARKQGIRFLRYDTPSDVGIETTDKGFKVSLKEATLPGIDLVLETDALVIPDSLATPPDFGRLAGQLRLGRDKEGFLQPANIRQRLIHSQRKGIYFAGPCHDDIDETDLDLEIQAIMADLEHQQPGAKSRISVNQEDCVKCLTCYRVCPHGAIVLTEKSHTRIMSDAGFECQACVSNCPAYAIESIGFANMDLAQGQKDRTLVFACERSAALAARTLPPHTDLVTIPCACRISLDIILRALIQGADRVIVSGCHQGNCRSGEGASLAQQGVKAVSALPGIPAGKVSWQPVAANEPAVFAKTISQT